METALIKDGCRAFKLLTAYMKHKYDGKKEKKTDTENPPITKQKTELPHCGCSPRGSILSCNFQTHVVTEEKLGHMVQ